MQFPPSVRAAFNGLDKAQQKAFQKEYSVRARSLTTAYVAWLLLGWHYLYLGKVGMQFAFWFTFGFLIVGWFVDFFRVPGMVRRANEDIARELMTQHRLLAS